MKTVISEKLEICNDEKMHTRVVELAFRYGKFVKSKNAKCSSKNRTVNNVQDLFEEIGQEDGSVAKSRIDYGTRKGLTHKPIPNHEVISVQVLHALLRTFDHVMKIAVRLRVEVFEWTESEGSHNHQSQRKVKEKFRRKSKK